MAKKQLITPIVLAAGVILGSAARVFTISQTNMSIGVLEHKSELLCNVLFYGLIAITAVLAAVFAGTPDKNGKNKPFEMLAGGTTATGFGLLAVGVGAGYDAQTALKCMSGSVVYAVISFVFAAAFVVLAFIMLYKKEITPVMGFACSFGGVFCMIKGVFFFREHMVVATIPEYLIEALSVVFGGLFFIMLGKLLTGNEGRLTRRMLAAFGTASAVLTLSAFIGALSAKLFLGEEISQRIVVTHAQAVEHFQAMRGIDGYLLSFPSFANIGLGIFAAVMVIVVRFTRNAKVSEKSDKAHTAEDE